MVKKLTKKQISDMDAHLTGWYELGWGIGGDKITPKAVSRLLLGMASVTHVSWYHNVAAGRAADEDVSPGEGFLAAAFLVREMAKRIGTKSFDVEALVRKYHKKAAKDSKAFDTLIRDGMNKIVPGYFSSGEGEMPKKIACRDDLFAYYGLPYSGKQTLENKLKPAPNTEVRLRFYSGGVDIRVRDTVSKDCVDVSCKYPFDATALDTVIANAKGRFDQERKRDQDGHKEDK